MNVSKFYTHILKKLNGLILNNTHLTQGILIMTLSTIITFVSPFSGWVIAALVASIVPYIWQFLHLQAGDVRRAYLSDAITNALNYAVSVAAKNPSSTDLASVRDDVIKTAAAYLKELTPEALAKLGVTDAGLSQLLEAKFVQGLDNLSDLFIKLAPGGANVPAANVVVTTSKPKPK